MRQRKFLHRQAIFNLISAYESMVQKGRVCFSDEQPYHDLIEYFEGECQLCRALEIADHAIAQFGFSAEFHIRKAELQLQNKQAEQALATLDRAEALSPGSLATSLLRAEGFASLDMCEDAIALLDDRKTEADSRELSQIYVCEALIYEQLKEYERMFYLLKAALAENPSNTDALSRMWYCVEYARKYEESVALHEKIIDEEPFNALAWYNLGAAHHYLCNHLEAIEAYEYAFLTKEDFEFAYRDCAEVCLYVQDYQKALQCYQEVMERFEPDADLFLHIGKCYLHLGNYLVAKTFFEKATHFDAYCDEAFFGMGECYAGLKAWRKAVDAYRRAVLIEDRHEDYFAGLAEAHFHLHNFKKAETFFREAADIAPEEARHWTRLAQFLVDRGRPEDALEVLDEAEDYAYGPELLYCRSACLFVMEKKKEALLALEDALFEDFDAHGSLFNLLPVLEQDREVQAVIATLKPDAPGGYG
jgi:tetratricopeptide (TPR) repeat protein